MKNVIFLDVDGVLLPARSYIRGWPKGFDPLAVDIIHHLRERFDPCTIVWNTTWNMHTDVLRKYIEHSGIGDTDSVHTKTEYPFLRSRLDAIEQWCSDYHSDEEVNWVAFDDAPIDHDRAIRVGTENGISVDDYREATNILGRPDDFMVLL